MRRRRWISRWGVVRIGVVLAAVAGLGGCMMWMPGESFRGPLPPLTEAQRELSDALRADVEMLSVTIGERSYRRPEALAAAAASVEDRFTALSYAVSRQAYEARGLAFANIEAAATGDTTPDQIVIVGAHYDSVEGVVGANDNATGVAAVLALARQFADRPHRRTLRFVAFVNEEPPFFQTDDMGSMVYARRCRERDENITTMVSFDGIGCYSDAPSSQQYPFPFNWFYPSTGNFIGFVGNVGSGSQVRRMIGTFRRHAQFPSEGGAMPGNLPGIGWSDHWAFWQHGYAGVMVTDSLPFRYAHYHTASDRIDQLDFDKMARVVDGMVPVIDDLVNSP